MRDDKLYQGLIGYVRVSTAGQGVSGLGLEAQMADIERYAASVRLPVLKIYREVESGRKHDRKELASAIAHCKEADALLVIARLDRLARSVYFTAKLMEERVDFVACDMPGVDQFVINVMAAVAEQEARTNSKRTKAALQAAKRRGVKLGNPNKWEGVREKANGARQEKARDFAEEIRPLIVRLLKKGEITYAGIAEELNVFGVKTRRGGSWFPMTVKRTMEHLGLELGAPTSALERYLKD